MSLKPVTLVVAVNTALTIVLLALHARWFTPPPPRFAVLDVAELYRLKETQITTVLIKPGASETERTEALKGAAAFGQDVTALIRALPDECRCLVLARGAVVGPGPQLPDLTPDLRRRLGL